jgi:hypothetical protein
MPVSLFEHQPERCPFGHLLGPGQVQIGWSPCICGPAGEAADRGRGMGHVRLHCLQCEAEGRASVFYEPPCDVRHRAQPGGWDLARPLCRLLRRRAQRAVP